jgi:hypothetical protein
VAGRICSGETVGGLEPDVRVVVPLAAFSQLAR